MACNCFAATTPDFSKYSLFNSRGGVLDGERENFQMDHYL